VRNYCSNPSNRLESPGFSRGEDVNGLMVTWMKDQATLLLLRHAKSSYPDGFPELIADHDRPLARRGVREAALAGDWLRANAPTIDGVLCSTATRARQTLSRSGIEAPVRYAERLYGATPGVMIEEINKVSDEVTTLLVVGHEPTMSSVALILAGSDGTDTAAVERLSAKYPTSAIAVLAVPCAWKSLGPGVAALTAFHVPRAN
jgi:phosphohistidine phosphatase